MIHSIKKNVLTLLTICGLAMFSVSCGDGNVSIPGVDGPNVHLVEDNVIISMTMQDLYMDLGATYYIPKYPNSSISLAPAIDGMGSVLQFNVSLDDMFSSDVQELDPKTLPGGRMIPGVAEGALPAVAFSLEDKMKGVAFYVGPKIFGIWIPLPKFEIYGLSWTKAFSAGSKRVGSISMFGKNMDGEHSGFFLALSTKTAYEQKKLKKLSKKY